jgi:hypothetical protein
MDFTVKSKKIGALVIIIWLIGTVINCTVLIRRPPKPAPIIEIRPIKPHPKAIWIQGHWKWSYKYKKWVWIPGHWQIK